MKKLTTILLWLGGAGLVAYLLFRSLKPAIPEPESTENFITQVAKYYNPSINDTEATKIANSVVKWSDKRNVNLFSILAIIAQESYFQPNPPDGSNGEKGLMQLSGIALDELERVYKINVNRNRLYEIDYNIELGTLYYLYCVPLTNKYRLLPEETFRFEAIARYNKTFEPERAKSYAGEVMAKRNAIVGLYNEFTKK